MCVADKDISKIELLTAGLMLLDTADTSPHGIISNKVMLWNFIKTVDEDKKRYGEFATRGLVGF